MPYPQDLVGKYLNYTIDQGGNLTTAMTNALVNGVLPNQTAPAVVPVFRDPVLTPQTRRHAVSGLQSMYQNTNNPWSFNYLRYITGGATIAPLGIGVVTGPMSGCYLFRYTEGGAQYVCHVGTAHNWESQESISVKEAWNTFAARPEVSEIYGATPADFFTQGEIAAGVMSGIVPQVLGYFVGPSAYAMLVVRLPMNLTPQGQSMLKVLSVKTMHLQPWSAIGAMRRFR